jgi:hypothetical protein
VGVAEDELDRLNAALVLVQGDLDRTLRAAAPRLRVLVVSDDAFVGGAGDEGGRSALYGPTDDQALFSVAEGAQECLIDLERLVWPLCPVHGHGVHVRPAGTARDWVYEPTEGGPLRPGPPVWWCRGGEGHDLDLVGQLTQSGRPGPKAKRRRKSSWSTPPAG